MKDDMIGNFRNRVHEMDRIELEEALLEYDQNYHKIVAAAKAKEAKEMRVYLEGKLSDFIDNFNAEKWVEADSALFGMAFFVEEAGRPWYGSYFWWQPLLEKLPPKLRKAIEDKLNLDEKYF